MYVCVCKSVTDRQIQQAVYQGAEDFATLQDCLGVSTNCGRCRDCASDVLQQALETRACISQVA